MYFDLGSFSIFADSDYVQIVYKVQIFVHGLEIKPESGVYGKAAVPARCPHLSSPYVKSYGCVRHVRSGLLPRTNPRVLLLGNLHGLAILASETYAYGNSTRVRLLSRARSSRLGHVVMKLWMPYGITR